MKAIYINLDPYIKAVADWLNAGRPGDAPKFGPLPLAVTVPLGQTAAILLQSSGEDAGSRAADTITVDGVTLNVQAQFSGDESAAVAFEYAPGFSEIAPASQYMVSTVSADSVSVTVHIYDEDETDYGFGITVLVRREQAQGPVDLVDFAPPASGTPSAAAIKSALVAAGSGALAGVSVDGVVAKASSDADPVELALAENNTFTLGAAGS